MSTATIDSRVSRFWRASIGKKVVMAVTGLIMFGYLIGHVLGNLQVFSGPEKINAYAEFLHHSPGILWGTRSVLLVALALHVVAAVQLYAQKHAARPQKYARWSRRTSSLPSRWMLWSGFAIFFFVIYHLLHFTVGVAALHPTFVEADVYQNMVSAFQTPYVAAIYIVAMALLCAHLFHGLYSMFQSVGVAHPVWTPRIKLAAALVALVLAAAFASIPIAILAGYGA
jgi:succinate dehydrogenase / fumarate reductase, cytochrome b subunit